MPKRVFSSQSIIPSSWLNLIENHTHSDPTAEGAGGDITTAVSAITASRIGSTGPAGVRNKLHNPLFSVAQRGGSGTVANGQNNWLFDRWRTQVANVAGCSLTVSASSMVIGGKPRKSMKVTNVASIASLPADSFVNPFTQGIEGRELVDMLGDSATIRCYIRASVAGDYSASLSVRNAAGTTIKCFNTRVSITANTITPVEFTLSTDAANWVCEDSANVGAYLSFCSLGGANYQTSTVDAWVSGNTPVPAGLTNWLATAGATVELCMPQLVRGTVAGEFDSLCDQDELDRCRYFLPGVVSALDPATLRGMGLVVMSAATTAVCFVPFGRPARGEPTGIYTTGSIGIAAGNNAAAAATPLTVDPLSSRNIGVFDTTTSFSSAAGIAGSFYAIPNFLCRVLFTGLEI